MKESTPRATVDSVLQRTLSGDQAALLNRRRAQSFPARAAKIREARGTGWLGVCALAGGTAVALALSAGPQAELAPIAGVAATLAWWRARRHFSLARRAEIGARSEQLVNRTLDPLRDEGWRIYTNVRWPGSGDLDVVALAPGGPTFVIETKTRRYTHLHLQRTAQAARLFTSAIPVLVTAVRGARRIEDDVNVCGRDELVAVLRRCHGDYHRHLNAVLERAASA